MNGLAHHRGYGDPIEARLSLPPEPASASRARRFLREVLASWGAERFEDRAILLTSELVTNVVLHARCSSEVVVRLEAGRLRVSVFDDVPLAPVRKHYGLDAATGRGLLLLEGMADAWATDSSGEGKVVWFELAGGEAADAVGTSAATAPLDALGNDGPGHGAPAAGAENGGDRPPGGRGRASSRDRLAPRLLATRA